MQQPGYYIGNMRDDAKNGGHRGWVVGKFLEEGKVAKTDDVEILYWEFPPGKIDHPTKVSTIIEITIILKGKIAGNIEEKPIIISQGEYIVIKPGTVNNIAQNALEDVVGITIKAPSDPSAKKVVDDVIVSE